MEPSGVHVCGVCGVVCGVCVVWGVLCVVCGVVCGVCVVWCVVCVGCGVWCVRGVVWCVVCGVCIMLEDIVHMWPSALGMWSSGGLRSTPV